MECLTIHKRSFQQQNYHHSWERGMGGCRNISPEGENPNWALEESESHPCNRIAKITIRIERNIRKGYLPFH